MLEAVILGVMQGITEFFPISSTAHLVLVPWLLGWEGTVDSLTFDVALHAGTLVSLLAALRKDIIDMVAKRRNLLLLLLVGAVPAGVAGLLLEEYVSGALRSPGVIAVSLVAFGLVMYYAETFKKRKKMERMTVLDALFVGVAQAVALIPGTSRSGITISAGLMRGVKREEAARFSFMLSIPVIAGATLLEGRKLIGSPGEYDLPLMGVGFAASLITGFLAIKFMLGYLRAHNMNVFIVYRFVVAGMIAGWLWLGG
jgi:undecaprenyl-diphosphatase